MTSLTWRCKSPYPLLGAGIDQVAIDRFETLLQGCDHPMPFVFSKQEIERARELSSPAAALAICFGAKEALLKAIGELYDFAQCEIFPDPVQGAAQVESEIALGAALKAHHPVRQAICRSHVGWGAPGEVTSVVLAFGEAP